LKVWSGLGYNRRAIWLHEVANELASKSSFPKTIKELEALKGIGPYTARAILIFAFNQDIATVDTNIRRILISEGLATEETSEKELFLIAAKVLPKGRARDWHNALMDYGSLVLTTKKTKIRPQSAKRPPYPNSNRYYRGRFVKFLISYGTATLHQLQQECRLEKDELEIILQKMIGERLIVKKLHHYQLP